MSLLLAFAFVSASFVARNSDVWLHLATGRLLANGEYRFGVDPFTYTATGQYWVNHAWLFDLGFYQVFRALGGAWLVGIKALAVVAAVGLMLSTARGNGPSWVTTGCLLLAVLAMSPRLLLQPTIASLLLLAGCLYCLRLGGRALIAVPILIAVWVNVDSWFLLGPVLVVLFWLGERMNPNPAARVSWPRWFFPAVLGACLLSPHHVHAFQLPWELSPAVWGSEFHSDPRFAGLFVSPWHWGPLGAAGGYNLAAWAFFVLLGLGLISFVVNSEARWSWRLVVWLPFAILAAWQVRLIPFFAVIAGPIIALNIGEVWPPAYYARSGRALVFVAGVVLLALGWQGWTNGVYNRERGAAWAVHTDPTLSRAAEGIATWRQTTAAPPEARVFPTHPDVGHYLAWFAPGERYFLDSRLQLFMGAAGDFATLSRAVGLLPDGGTESPVELFRRHDLVAALLYDPDGSRMARALAETTHGRWDILRIDGASVLSAPRGIAYAEPRFDPERAAFGGGSDLPVAASGPVQLAEPTPWWQPKREQGRTGSGEADAATIYLRLADVSSSRSPALSLLGIRASRVGIEIDPRDPIAWSSLGRAYLLLGARTWEREFGAALTPLGHIRFIQATGALAQAALLNPDSVTVHDRLAKLFFQRNMLDLAFRHASTAARLMRRAGPFTGESAEAFNQRTAEMQAVVDTIEGLMQDAENRFLVRTVGMTGDPLARARIAAAIGLTHKAIDILAESHYDLYGPPGLSLLADLLLQTGQIAKCRTLLDQSELRRNPDVLGYYDLVRKPNPDKTRWPYRFHTYDWLDLCQRAAAGQYPEALAAIDRLNDRLDDEEREQTSPAKKGIAHLIVNDVGLGVPPAPVLTQLVNLRQLADAAGLMARYKSLSITRADLATVAGVLELERGGTQAAKARFESARTLYKTAPEFSLSRPGEPLAARYYEAIRKAR